MTNKVPVHFQSDSDLKTAFDTELTQQGRSITEVLNQAMRDFLKSHGKSLPRENILEGVPDAQVEDVRLFVEYLQYDIKDPDRKETRKLFLDMLRSKRFKKAQK